MRRVFVLLGVLAGSGCPSPAPVSRLTEACLINSDCTPGLACVYRVCHLPCKVDSDCDPSSRCIAATDPGKTLICVLPSDSPAEGCRYDSQCPSGTVCGRDLVCRNQCLTSIDCVPNQLCVSGVCAKQSELLTDGGLTVPPTAPTEQHCAFSVDCPGTLVCRQGTCVKECLENRDCLVPGYVCDATSRCVLPGGDGGIGASCRIPSDCTDPLVCLSGTCGYECRADRDCDNSLTCCGNRCRTALYCSVTADGGTGRPDGGATDGGPRCVNDSQCDDGDWCNGTESCSNGVCKRAARGPCDDSNPCTVDTCINSPRTCSNVSTGPVDVDKDGYYDARCGLGADDCDDTRADVHPGAIEKCDWLDNNCNGSVDENAWIASGAPSAVVTSPKYYPLVGGPQAVVIGGEVKVVVPGWGTSGSIDGYRLDLQTLTLGQGPLPLIRSQTQWAQCGNILGQQVFAPRLFVSPTSLLTTALVASAPGVSCCPPNGIWEGGTEIAQMSQNFSGLANVENFHWVEPATYVCQGQPPNVAASDVVATWVSARNHWRLVFSDRRDQIPPVGNTRTLFTAQFDPATGLITGVKPLFQSSWASEISGSAGAVAFVRETNDGIFVAWTQRPASGFTSDHVRWSLFDFDMNGPLYQPIPFTIGGSSGETDTVTSALVLSGSVLLNVTGGGGADVELLVSTKTGAIQARASQSFATRGIARGPTTWPAESLPSQALSNQGFFVASKKVSALQPTLRLTWGRQDFDGGFFSTETVIGTAEPSPYQVIPISPTKVGVLWVSGEPDGGPGVLTRQFFQCTAP
jgi:Putative metal-binding motif